MSILTQFVGEWKAKSLNFDWCDIDGEFQMTKYPVTNEQYKLFVAATGHRVPKHWIGDESTGWQDGKIPKGKENHPVVNVSWHDAQAFCEWADVRLPTEAEWVKAATDNDGRLYPWGDEPPTAELCNFHNNVGDTTPVGNYPLGDSAYHVHDMAGNVLEWTADRYDDAQEYRVLRGGSWGNYGSNVRCANRVRNLPDLRSYNVGFRVVVGAPAVETLDDGDDCTYIVSHPFDNLRVPLIEQDGAYGDSTYNIIVGGSVWVLKTSIHPNHVCSKIYYQNGLLCLHLNDIALTPGVARQIIRATQYHYKRGVEDGHKEAIEAVKALIN